MRTLVRTAALVESWFDLLPEAQRATARELQAARFTNPAVSKGPSTTGTPADLARSSNPSMSSVPRARWGV